MENECDRMCAIADRCHAVVGASAVGYSIVGACRHRASDDNAAADRDGNTAKRLRRINRRCA